MKRRYSLLVGSLVCLGLVYSLGLARPIAAFLSALIFRLQFFKLGISQNEDSVKFLYWTDPRKLEYATIQLGDLASLRSVGFNASWPVKLLIHGFGDSGITSWTDRVRRAYLSTGNYNVISVDWEEMAQSPWYSTAARNSEAVGRVAARFLCWMVDDAGSSWLLVHVLGSSLGAHAAGYTGRFTHGRPARVTGLDPSGPLFHSVTPKDRLDRSDGQFVDVIHTAGRWVGDEDALGHVDFYVNGGVAPQPGCESHESLDLSCSHFRAWQLFVQSIPPPSVLQPALPALSCPSYSRLLSGLCCRGEQVHLGERVPTTARGTFHLRTTTKPYLLSPSEAFNCPADYTYRQQ